MPEIVIIGAGLTGLSAAFHLKKPCVILEKEKFPGGLCSSVNRRGFTFDHSGHFLHTHRPRTKALLESLMPVKLAGISRKASVIKSGRLVPYPFQANLYYLPERIRKECLEGFFNRRGTGVFRPNTPFVKWSEAVFGRGITRHFMKPYNEKLWTVTGNVLTADWVAPFVPRPDAEEIKEGAVNPQKKDFGYNVSFYYPEFGGCASIPGAFAAKLNNIRLGSAVKTVDLKNRCVLTSDGKRFDYDTLVSTQPLPELLESVPNLPSAIMDAAKALRWNSVECLNLAFKHSGRNAKPAKGNHWVYFPEKKYAFYRAGSYSNVLSSMSPAGHFSLYAEISRNPKEVFNRKEAVADCLSGLLDAGMIDRSHRLMFDEPLTLPYAYVIFDRKRTAALKTIFSYLRRHSVHSIGRYGAWEYSFMESSIIEGFKTAASLNEK